MYIIVGIGALIRIEVLINKQYIPWGAFWKKGARWNLYRGSQKTRTIPIDRKQTTKFWDHIIRVVTSYFIF